MFKLADLFCRPRVQALACLALSLILITVLSILAPQNIPVLLYKLLLPFLGGTAALFLWIALCPIGNPARWLAWDWRLDQNADCKGLADFTVRTDDRLPFCTSLLCCAIAFAAGVYGVAGGL